MNAVLTAIRQRATMTANSTTFDPVSIQPALVREHIDRAAKALCDVQADGLFLFRGSNLLAFTGVPLAPSDRLICAFLSSDGKIAFVVPQFEADMVRGLPAGSPIVTWREFEDPYAAAASAASAIGLEKGRILIDGHTWVDAHARLNQALSGASLARDVGVIEGVRVRKSPAEIAAMRAAAQDTGRIYTAMADVLRPGISELDALAEAMESLRGARITKWGDLVQSGPSASVPHQRTGRRVMQRGDAVIVDFVAQREGYLGDMTRTFAVESVSDEIKRAYGVVRDAQAAAIEAIRPGVSCESIDQAARRVIEAAGLGDYFVHRTGHGIGIDVHEAPYLVPGNKTVLEPGMVVTVEPGVYLPGQFGIRIEDVVAVTEGGNDVLSRDVPTDVSKQFSRPARAA